MADDRWKSPTIREIPKGKSALIIFSRMRVLDGGVKPDLHDATDGTKTGTRALPIPVFPMRIYSSEQQYETNYSW